MGTLIIDEDHYSRTAARALLLASGHGPVLEARDLDEARHWLESEESRITLILAHWRPEQGMDLPLARIVLAGPALDSVPLVLMIQDRSALGFIRHAGRFSRVDAHLYKPFGSKGLHQAVREAHRHRAAMRSTLLIVGERFQSELALALLFNRGDYHWTDLRTVATLAEASRALAREPFRISAILLDPGSWRETDRRWLRRFKKTPQGLGTQLACLSHDMREIGELRLCCDIFFAPPSEWSASRQSTAEPADPRFQGWSSILARLSRRVIRSWEIRQELLRFRASVRDGRMREARRCLDRAFQADERRWECQEARGDLLRILRRPQQAIVHYRNALTHNPCSVRSRLGILQTASPPEREKEALEALEFCPRHPGIRSARDT